MDISGAKDTWALLGLAANSWKKEGITLAGSGTCETVASLPYKIIMETPNIWLDNKLAGKESLCYILGRMRH